MASKRMSISALLTTDVGRSNQNPSTPSPATAASSPHPHPNPSSTPISNTADDEPPLKRARYAQSYYESYNAYPYTSHDTSASSHDNARPSASPNTHTQSSSSSSSSTHPHSNLNVNTTSGYYSPTSPTQWTSSSPSARFTGSIDFARMHHETRHLRPEEEKRVANLQLDGGRRMHSGEGRHLLGEGRQGRAEEGMPRAGESLRSVLRAQQGQSQSQTPLPAPPQLRRDASHQQRYQQHAQQQQQHAQQQQQHPHQQHQQQHPHHQQQHQQQPQHQQQQQLAQQHAQQQQQQQQRAQQYHAQQQQQAQQHHPQQRSPQQQQQLAQEQFAQQQQELAHHHAQQREHQHREQQQGDRDPQRSPPPPPPRPRARRYTTTNENSESPPDNVHSRDISPILANSPPLPNTTRTHNTYHRPNNSFPAFDQRPLPSPSSSSPFPDSRVPAPLNTRVAPLQPKTLSLSPVHAKSFKLSPVNTRLPSPASASYPLSASTTYPSSAYPSSASASASSPASSSANAPHPLSGNTTYAPSPSVQYSLHPNASYTPPINLRHLSPSIAKVPAEHMDSHPHSRPSSSSARQPSSSRPMTGSSNVYSSGGTESPPTRAVRPHENYASRFPNEGYSNNRSQNEVYSPNRSPDDSYTNYASGAPPQDVHGNRSTQEVRESKPLREAYESISSQEVHPKRFPQEVHIARPPHEMHQTRIPQGVHPARSPHEAHPTRLSQEKLGSRVPHEMQANRVANEMYTKPAFETNAEERSPREILTVTRSPQEATRSPRQVHAVIRPSPETLVRRSSPVMHGGRRSPSEVYTRMRLPPGAAETTIPQSRNALSPDTSMVSRLPSESFAPTKSPLEQKKSHVRSNRLYYDESEQHQAQAASKSSHHVPKPPNPQIDWPRTTTKALPTTAPAESHGQSTSEVYRTSPTEIYQQPLMEAYESVGTFVVSPKSLPETSPSIDIHVSPDPHSPIAKSSVPSRIPAEMASTMSPLGPHASSKPSVKAFASNKLPIEEASTTATTTKSMLVNMHASGPSLSKGKQPLSVIPPTELHSISPRSLTEALDNTMPIVEPVVWSSADVHTPAMKSLRGNGPVKHEAHTPIHEVDAGDMMVAQEGITDAQSSHKAVAQTTQSIEEIISHTQVEQEDAPNLREGSMTLLSPRANPLLTPRVPSPDETLRTPTPLAIKGDTVQASRGVDPEQQERVLLRERDGTPQSSRVNSPVVHERPISQSQTQTQPQWPPPPPRLEAPVPPVLQLRPPSADVATVPTAKVSTKTSDPMDVDEERSFEDELLSLVDDDVKPPPLTVIPVLTLTPETASEPAETTPSKSKASPTKPKARPRVPNKGSKGKPGGTTRQTSGASTPAPASSMPPPSPPPQSSKQQQRMKGKSSGKTGGPSGNSSRKKASSSASSKPATTTSLKPEASIPDLDVEMAETQDDKLYCLCKTPYDEEKVMIACDRCDEWYHPACVGMPEAEVDLVDQFICQDCARKNPTWRTTYKRRCHRGLHYIVPYDELPTCWKPARGAFSKYCSDECGMAFMRAKIAQSGRDPAELWPIVKSARKREGVTISYGKAHKMNVDEDGENRDVDKRMAARKAREEADKREMSELLRKLEDVMRMREECKLALERVVARRRLLDLAVDRAGGNFCGWDARLAMGDTEWAEWIGTEEGRRAIDGTEGEESGEVWWCTGPDKCPRHMGWQTVRDHDVQLDVDSKNASIKQLTDRERELRRRIEDLDPPSVSLKAHGKAGGRRKPPGRKILR